MSPKKLRGRRFVSMRRGVVMVSSSDAAPSLRDRVRAALLVLPAGTVIIGVTGLRLRGVEVGPAAPLRFASIHPYVIRRAGVSVARVRSLPQTVRGELPLAIVEHCFLTAAPHLTLVDLVIAGDWLLRRKLTTRDRLCAHVASHSRPGVQLARQAVTLMAERVDSPRETTLRLCLVLAGLPTPRCNITLGTEDHPIGRVDLVYLELKLIIEYEGDQHRVDRRQWNIDIDRAEQFTAQGYATLRITAQRMKRPRMVVFKVFHEMRRRGYTGPEPVFTRAWCATFESDEQ